MRKLQSFVGIVGHSAIRMRVQESEGSFTLNMLDGTLVTSIPASVMTAAHLRSSMEQRELKTGHRSSLLVTSTVGLPSHVWKESSSLEDLLTRNPWDFRPSVVKAVIDGLAETYAVVEEIAA